MEPPTASIFVRTRAFQVKTRHIHRIVQICLFELGMEAFDVSISLVNGSEVRKLNRKYRDKDQATDVLSFPQWDFSKKPLIPGQKRRIAPKLAQKRLPPFKQLGDIVISLPQAAKNAREIGQTLDREVAFLIVHGILHLCGHDHHQREEERVMRQAQRNLMKKLEQPEHPVWVGCVSRRKRMVSV